MHLSIDFYVAFTRSHVPLEQLLPDRRALSATVADHQVMLD